MDVAATSIAYVITSSLGHIARSCNYATSTQSFIDSLDVEVSELKCMKDDIKRDIDRATWEGMRVKGQVRFWLKSVDVLTDKATKLQLRFDERCKFYWCSCSPNVFLYNSISKKAEKLVARARDLKSTRESFNGVSDKLTPERLIRVHSVWTVGIDALLGQLKALVDDDDIGIIGVHGMGGVGKTTLLARYHNEVLASGALDLDLVIWINVTDDLGVDGVQKAIGARLGLEWKDDKSQQERREILFKVLHTMRFVIIFDNLWAPLALDSVGVPVPGSESKCKIILSTRLEEVCDRMDARKIKVGCLQKDEAWELFSAKIGSNLINSSNTVSKLANRLVNKCGGLPLAIVTIARSMGSKISSIEWSHTVNIMDRHPHQLRDFEEHVLWPLKLSYDHLPNDKLKACFLFLFLFAENLQLQVSTLVRYWICDPEINVRNSPEASYLLGILRASSLVETSSDVQQITTHPIIRCMALWVANDCGKQENKWLVTTKGPLTDALKAEAWSDSERISIDNSSICNLPEAPQCPNLVLMMLKGSTVIETLPDDFFSFMPRLRILNLGYSSIRELPSQIKNLFSLNYLSLRSSKIMSLPKELGDLVNLQYLGLTLMPDLKVIPDGVLARLTRLLYLDMFHSYGGWKVQSNGGSGIDIEELENLKNLEELQLTVENTDALEWLSGSVKLRACTKHIVIRDCRGLKDIWFSPATFWRGMTSLYSINLSEMGESQEIVISDSGKEEFILPNIQILSVKSLHCLLRIRVINGSRFLNRLLELEIEKCSKMEQLLEFEFGNGGAVSSEMTILPELKKLVLRNLPELKSLSGSEGHSAPQLIFPSLEKIEVTECPQLKKLNLVAKKLKKLECKESWWSQLVWDDDEVRSSFEAVMVAKS